MSQLVLTVWQSFPTYEAQPGPVIRQDVRTPRITEMFFLSSLGPIIDRSHPYASCRGRNWLRLGLEWVGSHVRPSLYLTGPPEPIQRLLCPVKGLLTPKMDRDRLCAFKLRFKPE